VKAATYRVRLEQGKADRLARRAQSRSTQLREMGGHAVRLQRAAVLTTAYSAHPERFVRRAPTPPPLPGPAWINRPKEDEDAQTIS